MTEIEKIVHDTLGVLNAVTADLLEGIEESSLLNKYRGQYVAPGVTIRDHLKDLRNGRCIVLENKKLQLKSQCDPRRFAHC